MREQDRKNAIRVAMANPQPAIRNEIRPVEQTVRAKVIPPPSRTVSFDGPNVDDVGCRVYVLRKGQYFSPRMGPVYTMQHLRIEFGGDILHVWHWDTWGLEGDDTRLELDFPAWICGEVEVEWWDEEDLGERNLTYQSIIPVVRSWDKGIRHVAEVLAELTTEGSVSLR